MYRSIIGILLATLLCMAMLSTRSTVSIKLFTPSTGAMGLMLMPTSCEHCPFNGVAGRLSVRPPSTNQCSWSRTGAKSRGIQLEANKVSMSGPLLKYRALPVLSSVAQTISGFGSSSMLRALRWRSSAAFSPSCFRSPVALNLNLIRLKFFSLSNISTMSAGTCPSASSAPMIEPTLLPDTTSNTKPASYSACKAPSGRNPWRHLQKVQGWFCNSTSFSLRSEYRLQEPFLV